MNYSIYVNKENEEILKEVLPGRNISQKIAFLIESYNNQMVGE